MTKKPDTKKVFIAASGLHGRPVFVASGLAVTRCSCGAGQHPALLCFDSDGKHFATVNIMPESLAEFIKEAVEACGAEARITVHGAALGTPGVKH